MLSMHGGPGQQSLPSISQSLTTSASAPGGDRQALAKRHKAKQQKREAMYDYPAVTEPREALKKKILGSSVSTGSMRLGGVKLMPVKGHPQDEQTNELIRAERKRADEHAEKKWRKKFEEWQRQGYAPPSKRAAELDLRDSVELDDSKSEKSGEILPGSPGGHRGKSRHTASTSDGSAQEQLPPVRAEVKMMQGRAENAEAEATRVRVENLKLMQESNQLKSQAQTLEGDLSQLKEKCEGLKYDLFVEQEANNDLERRIRLAVDECDYWRSRAHRREDTMEADSVEREMCWIQVEGISRMIEGLNALADGDLSGPSVSTLTASAQGMTMPPSALQPRQRHLKTQPWRISYAKRSHQYQEVSEPLATPAGRLPYRPDYNEEATRSVTRIQCAWRQRTARNEVKRRQGVATPPRRAAMMHEQFERDREERDLAERKRRVQAATTIQKNRRALSARAEVEKRREEKAAEEQAQLQKEQAEALEQQLQLQQQQQQQQLHEETTETPKAVNAKGTPEAADKEESEDEYDEDEDEAGGQEGKAAAVEVGLGSALGHDAEDDDYGEDDEFDDDGNAGDSKTLLPGATYADPASVALKTDFGTELGSKGVSPKAVPTYNEVDFQKRLAEELERADKERTREDRKRREAEEKEMQKRVDEMVKERVAEETKRLTATLQQEGTKDASVGEEEVQKRVDELVAQRLAKEKEKDRVDEDQRRRQWDEYQEAQRERMEEEQEAHRKLVAEEQGAQRKKFESEMDALEEQRKRLEDEQEQRRQALVDEEARMRAMIQEEEERMDKLRQEVQQQLTQEQEKMRVLVAQQEDNLARRLEDVLLQRFAAMNRQPSAQSNAATIRLDDEALDMGERHALDDSAMSDENIQAQRILREQLQSPVAVSSHQAPPGLSPSNRGDDATQLLATCSLKGTVPGLFSLPEDSAEADDASHKFLRVPKANRTNATDSWQGSLNTVSDDTEDAQTVHAIRSLMMASLQGNTIPSLATSEGGSDRAAENARAIRDLSSTSLGGTIPMLMMELQQLSPSARHLLMASMEPQASQEKDAAVSRRGTPPTPPLLPPQDNSSMEREMADESTVERESTKASVEREMTEASLIEREITKEPGTEQEQETTHVSTEEEQPSMGLEGQKCVRGLATASVSGEISGKGLTDASLMRSITSDDADEIGILQAAVAPPNESVREDAAEADGGALEAALEDHEDRDETMPGGFDTGDVPTPPGRAVTSYAGLGIHNSPEKLARDEQEGLATPAAKGLPPLPEASEDEARLKAKLPLSSSARELSFSRPETALTDSQTQDEENAEELRVMCAERLMTAMSTGELETAIDGIERHRGATPPPDGRIDILRTDLSDVPEGPESPASAFYAPRGAGAV